MSLRRFDGEQPMPVGSEAATAASATRATPNADEVRASPRTGTGLGSSVAAWDAEARANMYRFLAAVFLAPPSRDLLCQLVAKDFLDDISSLLGSGAVAELRAFADDVHPELDQPALKREYMDLFAVPSGRYTTPFEDVYGAETASGGQERGPLLGERAVAVIRMHREAGAQLDRACRELPTHIGVELLFMSFLCEREAAETAEGRGDVPSADEMDRGACSSRYRDIALRFLQEHLMGWFPQLRRAIQRNARSHLYTGLSSLTDVFLALDTSYLLARIDSE